jgi:uncharacterized OB-fold protein
MERDMASTSNRQAEGFDDDFWEGVRQGKLLIQRCISCGTLRHPPTPMCGVCQSLDHEAVPASGRGTLCSWILSHHPSAPDDAARIVALVQLEEGCRMVSNLVDIEAKDIRNDMPVEVCFGEWRNIAIPQFRSVASGST